MQAEPASSFLLFSSCNLSAFIIRDDTIIRIDIAAHMVAWFAHILLYLLVLLASPSSLLPAHFPTPVMQRIHLWFAFCCIGRLAS